MFCICGARSEGMSNHELFEAWNRDRLELENYMRTVGQIIGKEAEKEEVIEESKRSVSAEDEALPSSLTFPETIRKMTIVLERFKSHIELAKTRTAKPTKFCWVFDKQNCLKYTLTALKYIASGSGVWIVFEDSEDVSSKLIGVGIFVVGQLIGVLDDVVLNQMVTDLNSRAELQKIVAREWFIETVESFLRILKKLERLETLKDDIQKDRELEDVIDELDELGWQVKRDSVPELDIDQIGALIEKRHMAQRRWNALRRRVVPGAGEEESKRSWQARKKVMRRLTSQTRPLESAMTTEGEGGTSASSLFSGMASTTPPVREKPVGDVVYVTVREEGGSESS